jgi:predicted transcriptional regulator
MKDDDNEPYSSEQLQTDAMMLGMSELSTISAIADMSRTMATEEVVKIMLKVKILECSVMGMLSASFRKQRPEFEELKEQLQREIVGLNGLIQRLTDTFDKEEKRRATH